MQSLSLDKMMVPFTGTCPAKQFVPNKPNPEGLKVLVQANSDGVVCDFVVYQGKQTFPEDMNEKFWQCECSILILTRSLVPGYVLYIDRFFYRTRLADQLIDQGIRLTGTLIKSRVPKNTDLPDDQGFKKNNERGTSAVTVREDGKMVITKWLDNNSVNMLSTHESADPMINVRRWSKSQKKVHYPTSATSYSRLHQEYGRS